jgi:hypothetical protein
LPEFPVRPVVIPLSDFRQEWRAPAYRDYRADSSHHRPNEKEIEFMHSPEQHAEEREAEALFLWRKRRTALKSGILPWPDPDSDRPPYALD